MIGTANATMKVEFPLTVDLVKHRVLKNGKVRQHRINVAASVPLE